MIIAPKPLNESQRLQALKDYDVLDTGAEANFDAIVELASQICDTPIALISLIDSDRQWFKARKGLDAEETHRDLAFCAHAIHLSEPLVVENALLDERFNDNPLVSGHPNIRFYAGAPLQTPEGFRIGTLCTIDTKPHKLNQDQLSALKTLSNHVINLLELRKQFQRSVQLNEELLEKNKTIQELMEHNKRFLANINHEMRTPLNAISGFSGQLKKRVAKLELPGFVEDGLNSIAMASKHLHNLINDVLDLSKLDAGKMECMPAPFNVKNMLQEVLTINSIRAEENGVNLSLQINEAIPESLMADEKKISQVLINIISNAVKFTPENKSVSVTADLIDQDLLIVVSDEGVGIPPSSMQKIFEEFTQIPNSLSNRAKGTGLGLAIANRLTHTLGGDIQVSSEVDVGTTFKLRFPTQSCDAIAPYL